MTSIEYLEKEYNENKGFLGSSNFEQAKQMHKDEIIEGYCNGCKDIIHNESIFPRETSEQYYEDTYGNKGSGEVELPQQEISDEEIEKVGNRFVFNENGYFFKQGAKWYREQLKQNQ
jgi:hypothetical protein